MATIEGGGTSQIPQEQQQAASEVLQASFTQLEELVGADVTLQSEYQSPEVNVFSAPLALDIQTITLFLFTPIPRTNGQTINLIETFIDITTEKLSSLEGVTANGDGTFSLSLSSYVKQSGSLSLQDSPVSVHALSVDGTSGFGVDSLAGGGSSVSDAQAAFITSAAENMGLSSTTLANIASGLKLMSKAGTTAAADIGIEIARLTLSDNSNFNEIGLTYAEDTLVFARLDDLPGGTLVLNGMDKALVIGSGTVRVDSGTGSLLVGDSSNQVLISGAGNDTLVGGGGRDSLVGGGGADVFGFNTRGHYTITDFTPGVDKAYFEFAGVTTLAQVKSYLTGVTENNGSTTFHFGADASITLVGVSANAVLGPLLFDI